MLEEKEIVLSEFQKLGCLHIVPLAPNIEGESVTGTSTRSREALDFLLSYPRRRHQVVKSAGFNASEVEQHVLKVKDHLHALHDERDHLTDRIKHMRPWGDFVFPSLEELKNYRLWFYVIPHHMMKKVEASDIQWALVKKDERFNYVVVVSQEEPERMPVPRTMMGAKSLSELEHRLMEVDNKIDDLDSARFSLTRWCELYAGNLGALENIREMKKVTGCTLDDKPLFVLQAWAPRERVKALTEYCESQYIAIEIQEPTPEDNPPTLLYNPPALASGQDLLTFYKTPSYWLSDPSLIIMFSFVVFFAMIISDAGYGVIFLFVLLLLWKNMGSTESGRRMRILCAMLIFSTLVWGVMVGSYFCVEPKAGSFLARLKVFELNDFNTMMMVSVIVGIVHIIISNIVVIARNGLKDASLAPLGWIFVIVGASILAVVQGNTQTAAGVTGLVIICIGGMMVFLFSGAGEPLVKRILEGLHSLTRITNVFSDILSYLRLFALGLASASLGMAFNGLGKEVMTTVPGIGFFLGILIYLLGHTLNLLMGIMSGVIHGLRLNLIEFLNWSIPEEGYLFRAFARKEES